MKAIKTEDTNTEVRPVLINANIKPLPVWTDGRCCISVWEVTDEDLINLAKDRKMYLMVGAPPDTRIHPMVGLSSENIIPEKRSLF